MRDKMMRDNFDKFEHVTGTSKKPGSVTITNDFVSPGGAFKATFDIIIQRLTNNINLPLPIGILGFAQIASGYLGLLNLPAGVTLSITGGASDGLPNSYEFEFTQGGNVDIITVTCPQIPYPSFLNNSAVDMYRINNIRYFISDGLVQAQFTRVLNFMDSGIFGVKTQNPLTPSTFINPMDEKNNIVDIPVGVPFDKEKCIVTEIEAQAAFTVGLTFFVELYDKMTAKSVGL